MEKTDTSRDALAAMSASELLGLRFTASEALVNDSGLWEGLLRGLSPQIHALLSSLDGEGRRVALGLFYLTSRFRQPEWDFWFRAYAELVLVLEDDERFDTVQKFANEEWTYLGIEKWRRFVEALAEAPLMWGALVALENFPAIALFLAAASFSTLTSVVNQVVDVPTLAWRNLPDPEDLLLMVNIEESVSTVTIEAAGDLAALSSEISILANQRKVATPGVVLVLLGLPGSDQEKGDVLTSYLASIYQNWDEVKTRENPPEPLPEEVLELIRADDAEALADYLSERYANEDLMLRVAERSRSTAVLDLLYDLYGIEADVDPYDEALEDEEREREELEEKYGA